MKIISGSVWVTECLVKSFSLVLLPVPYIVYLYFRLLSSIKFEDKNLVLIVLVTGHCLYSTYQKYLL